MSDVFTTEQRSRVMAAVRGRDTRPEIRLRRLLHARGLRFRLHGRHRGARLPGRPDLVFASARAVVFVHGCFWHRHPGCPRATTPASRTNYWGPKFERNVARDREVQNALAAAGWRVALVWECGLTARRAGETADAVAVWLRGTERTLDLP